MTKEQIRELLKAFEDKTYEELLGLAGEAAYKIIPVFNKLGDDDLDGTTLLLLFIGSSLVADGKLSSLETRFVSDLLGVEKELVISLAKEVYKQPGLFELINKVFDASMFELADELLKFCCCFLVVDKNVSIEEVNFIKKLIEY